MTPAATPPRTEPAVKPEKLAHGSLIVRRHFEHRRISRVWAGRVVSDDQRGLLIWIADGSAARDVGAADGRPFSEVPFAEWESTPKALDPAPWRGDALMFHPPGAGYSVWWFFDPGARFRCWYVNLERPAVRWADAGLAGIDTTDHDIDIVVGPGRDWEWKDEELFTEFLKYEHYWVEDEAAVRAAGAQAVALIEQAAFPFDGTWCDFVPDDRWTVPRDLPPGWERPRAF